MVSDSSFRQIVEHLPTAIAVIDRSLRYSYVNASWQNHYNLSKNEVIGKTHQEIFDEDVFTTILERCLEGEAYQEGAYIRHQDRLPVRRTVQLDISDEGTITGVIVYSEFGRTHSQQHSQDSLEAQHRFLRQVIDLNTSFIFSKDEEGRFTLVNKALADHYGAHPDDMVGKYDEDFNPNPVENVQFRRDDLEVITTRTGKFIPEEPVTNAVTRETRWYQTIKVPLIEEDGKTVQLLGVATDITERKWAQDALEAQHRFLRQVIDLNTSFIFSKDEEGRFTLVNKALADHYGAHPDDMVGKYDEDFNPNPVENVQFRRDDLEVITTRTGKFIPEEPVTNAVTGETRWYQTIKVPLIEDDDKTVQLLGVATDITERKKTEEQLQQSVVKEQAARQQAEEASRMKDVFMMNMSHELRTPLNAIIGFLREMLYSHQLSADNTHMAERSLANSKRLLTLINSLLDLSRLASGGLEIVCSQVQIHDLAKDIINDLRLQAKQQHLNLELEISDDLPQVIYHDEERLLQIMTNLLTNALKFTRQGSVKLNLWREETILHIHVADTGMGIPQDKLSSVFNDFVQLGADAQKSGVGLGLSIVKQLVELMHGKIYIESQVNEYTVFDIELPLNLEST